MIKRQGFTLIELLVTIAITSILAVIMFTNFSKEKDRNAIKAAVHQIQTDLQTLQTNAQSGVLYNGVAQLGYGLYAAMPSGTVVLFGDTNGNKLKDAAEPIIATRQFSSGVILERVLEGTYTSLTITYGAPNGAAQLTGTVASTNTTISPRTTLKLKSNKLNLCYAVTVTAGVGTVSQKQLTTCS